MVKLSGRSVITHRLAVGLRDRGRPTALGLVTLILVSCTGLNGVLDPDPYAPGPGVVPPHFTRLADGTDPMWALYVGRHGEQTCLIVEDGGDSNGRSCSIVVGAITGFRHQLSRRTRRGLLMEVVAGYVSPAARSVTLRAANGSSVNPELLVSPGSGVRFFAQAVPRQTGVVLLEAIGDHAVVIGRTTLPSGMSADGGAGR